MALCYWLRVTVFVSPSFFGEGGGHLLSAFAATVVAAFVATVPAVTAATAASVMTDSLQFGRIGIAYLHYLADKMQVLTC